MAGQDAGSTEALGWKHLRLVWCDAAGIRRTRVVPAARWEEIKSMGLGVAYACMFLPASGDSCPPDPAAKPVGEMRVRPAGPPRVLPWHPAHAMALVQAFPETDPSGAPWECCPRSALARVLQQAQQELGMTIQAGFESEFILLDKSKPHSNGSLPPPIDDSCYCQTSALDAAAPLLDEIADALGALGIEVEQLHPEAAPGQFELVTRYGEAVQSCDNLLFTREAIASVAAQRGLLATFLPKLWDGQAGNGGHCHFSVWKDGRNLLAPAGEGGGAMAPEGEAFLAGVMAHLPALLCFTAPSPNSYRRLQPSCWSGAFRCWGWQNREAALRLAASPGRPESTNCEIKGFDATANPYLGLAAVVVAGMEGVRRGLKLPPQQGVDPGTLSSSELAAQGIERLPGDLGQALEALRSNTELRSALEASLGATLVRAYLVVRATDLKAFEGMSMPEEVAALYTRY